MLPPSDGVKYLVGVFDKTSRKLRVYESPFGVAELRYVPPARVGVDGDDILGEGVFSLNTFVVAV